MADRDVKLNIIAQATGKEALLLTEKGVNRIAIASQEASVASQKMVTTATTGLTSMTKSVVSTAEAMKRLGVGGGMDQITKSSEQAIVSTEKLSMAASTGLDKIAASAIKAGQATATIGDKAEQSAAKTAVIGPGLERAMTAGVSRATEGVSAATKRAEDSLHRLSGVKFTGLLSSAKIASGAMSDLGIKTIGVMKSVERLSTAAPKGKPLATSMFVSMFDDIDRRAKNTSGVLTTVFGKAGMAMRGLAQAMVPAKTAMDAKKVAADRLTQAMNATATAGQKMAATAGLVFKSNMMDEKTFNANVAAYERQRAGLDGVRGSVTNTAAAFQALVIDVRQATADFRAGILSAEGYKVAMANARMEAIAMRKATGQLTGKELVQFNSVMAQTNQKTHALPHGLRSVTRSMSHLGLAAAGSHGPLGSIISHLAFMGGPQMMIALGIFGGLVFLLSKIAGGANKARKELKELLDAQAKIRSETRAGEAAKEAKVQEDLQAALVKNRVEQIQLQQSLEKLRATWGSVGVFLYGSGAKAALQDRKDQENEIIIALNTQLKKKHEAHTQLIDDYELETKMLGRDAVEQAKLFVIKEKMHDVDARRYILAVKIRQERENELATEAINRETAAIGLNIRQRAHLHTIQMKMSQEQADAYMAAVDANIVAQEANALWEERLALIKETNLVEQFNLNLSVTRSRLPTFRGFGQPEEAPRPRFNLSGVPGVSGQNPFDQSGQFGTFGVGPAIDDGIQTYEEQFNAFVDKIKSGFGDSREAAAEFAHELERSRDNVVQPFGDAFAAVFEAIATGSKLSAAALVKGLLQGISRAALSESAFYFARGVAALASSFFPFPNEGGKVSAAMYFKAAALMGAIGAGAGLIGGAVSGGGSNARSPDQFGERGSADQGEGTIVIVGNPLSTDERFLEELGRAIDSMRGRRRITITAGN